MILPCVKVQSDYRTSTTSSACARCASACRSSGRATTLRCWARPASASGRSTKLAGEVGWDRLDAFVSAWLDYSEGRMAEAIRRLPNGRLTVHTQHDPFERVPDGVPLTVTVRDHRRRDRGRPARQPRLPPVRPQPDRGDRPLGGDAGRDERHQRLCARQRRHVPAAARALRENCVVGIPRHPASCSVSTCNLPDRVGNAVQRAIAELAEGYGMAEVGLSVPASVGGPVGTRPRATAASRSSTSSCSPSPAARAAPSPTAG